jgi:glycerol kinase
LADSFILSIDQGTSGTKTVIISEQADIVTKATTPLKSYFPQTGFVEQDPQEIYVSVLDSVKQCLANFKEQGGDASQIKTCGISNQRETLVLWDKNGTPLHNAVVWQCKRSVEVCNQLKATGIEDEISKRTGLIIDPYFSGTKLIWLVQNKPEIAKAVKSGEAFFGTIDTWLLYKLTGGKSFLTDHTNASRTLLFNINNLAWDDFLINEFGLTGIKLAEVTHSSGNFGETDFDGLLSDKISINGMIGDSHAAAFGEGCFQSGMAKATLGTGSSILMNVGDSPKTSKSGMMSTICWSLPGRVDYAFEGVIVSAGATIQWMRDQLGLFAKSSETEAMATSVDDNGGVYVIPGFSGLGAPHWKMDAKGAIIGLTFGATKNHIARAALESIPYQIKDVIEAVNQDVGIPLKELKVDGGITCNKFVMQFLADVLGCKIVNIGVADVSALGAGLMAGLGAGVFKDIHQISSLLESQNEYNPGSNKQSVAFWYSRWKEHIQKY